MVTPLEGFERLLVAVLAGLLIGLDRERAEMRKQQTFFAGVRTFPLIALGGAIPALLIDVTGPILLVAAFVAVAALTVLAYYRRVPAGEVGATTEAAALATFLLGALAGVGQVLLAGGVGIAVAVLLVAKPRLEGFSRALSKEELDSTLELAVISCIVLPLLPDEAFGPWGVLNPFDIWLIVVLVSGLSFAGFIAMRLFGDEKGMVVAGVVGALVSSTAVTAAMANRSRADHRLARSAATATVLASAVMCLRVAVLAAAAGAGILPRLTPVILVMSIAGAASGWILAKATVVPAAGAAEARIANPFSLRAAVIFGAIYAFVLLGVRAAREFLGASGVYLAAAMSSLADVDAVTIAFARGGPAPTGWREPAAAVTVAIVINTLVKLGIAVTLGAGAFRRYVALSLALMSLLGAGAGAVVFVGF